MDDQRPIKLERLREIFHKAYYFFLRILFKRYIQNIDKNKTLLVFDIDNTLALTRESSNQDKRFLDANKNLCDAAAHFLNSDDIVTIFISVRPISEFFKTSFWLEKNISSSNKKTLFLTRSPQQKINLLHDITQIKNKLLIDDLSFNIGKEIMIMHDVLDSINNQNLRYLGLEFINKTKSMEKLEVISLIKNNLIS